MKSGKGKFDIKFLDAPLCSIGKAEAIKAQIAVENLPIKYVISSPLARTLETTKLVFENHPQRKLIQVIVNPLIRECLANPDDIPNWTLKYQKEKYNTNSELNYNFGMLETMHPGLYFLDTVESELKNSIMDKLKVVGEEKYPEVIVEMMLEKYNTGLRHHKHLESNANGRKRGKLFLEWLQNFIKEKSIKSNEVAVVSHMAFIQCMATQSLNEDGKPVYPIVPNAEPFEINIDEVLKYHESPS